MSKKFVVINNNGEVFSHFPDSTGLYASLCGLDGDDTRVNQSTVGNRSTVDCPDCIRLFDHTKSFTEQDITRMH